MTYDLSITGAWGFYTIVTPTPKGVEWAKKHLAEALPPNVLNRIVRSSVKALVDEDKMEAIKEQEEDDKTRLREAVAELS